MRSLRRPAGLIGFGLAAAFAVAENWSLPEFCWSTWLTGLAYSWACVLTAAGQILFTAGRQRADYDAALPFLRALGPAAFLAGIALATLLAGGIAFYIYTWLFGFYGLFLSVFAEMEPHALFGRNGFINSDFFTPVQYLAGKFWPMVLGTLIANVDGFLQERPWLRIAQPFRSNAILRIHILTIALPFVSLFAWALLGTAYQPVTIVLLLAVLYFLPQRAGPGPAVAPDR
jgi:hypothetical protein